MMRQYLDFKSLLQEAFKNKSLYLLAFIALVDVLTRSHLGASPIASPELSVLFNDNVRIWEMKVRAFMRLESHNGFAWDSMHEQRSARSTNSKLRFLDIPVVEANAFFNNETLDKLTLSLYNRGDTGWVVEDKFKDSIVSYQKKITKWAGRAPLVKDKQRQTNYIRKYMLSWRRGETRIDLEWSGTEKRKVDGVIHPFRAEYIRVTLTPAHKSSSELGRLLTSKEKSSQIFYSKVKSKVKRDRHGDVYLEDVPMVNQGDKNYCSVATASRVMGYYGRDIDQHELAQIVDTSVLGTDPIRMIEALKRVAFKLNVRVRVHQEFERKEFVKLVHEYNKSRPVRLHQIPKIVLDGLISVVQVYAQMDTDTLKEIRTRKTADRIRFARIVTQHVDIGIPVIWSAIIGKVEETPPLPNEVGGHTRLIIGYNKKAGQIIYTDSWGGGHEFKRMPIADAMAITTGLFTIEPRSRRS